MAKNFPRLASELFQRLSGATRVTVSADKDADWQRVNSYIADTLKDTHVLYAKLARLQGDFAGTELEELRVISESVLSLGSQLSKFSKEFDQGNYEMQQSQFVYGDQGGAPMPNPAAQQQQTPAQQAPESFDEIPVESQDYDDEDGDEQEQQDDEQEQQDE